MDAVNRYRHGTALLSLALCVCGAAKASSHDVAWVFGNNGFSDYILNSYSPPGAQFGPMGALDPDLTLRLHARYRATVVNYLSHPLQIVSKASSFTSDVVLLSMGPAQGSFELDPDVAFEDSGSGTITFTLTTGLYEAMKAGGRRPGYRCEPHAPFMRGNFTVVGLPLGDPIPMAIGKGAVKIEFKTIASGLAAPVLLTPAADGSGRLFVVDQAGLIHIIQHGALVPKPWLDVSARLHMPGLFGTMDATDYDERGFLGMALHPGFADPASAGHGKIYTYTSEPAILPADFTTNPPPDTVDHQSVIAEWTVDATDANLIDTATRREIMRIDQPQFNHNGGMLAFGRDGYLYISLGDGGGADDTGDGHGLVGNGQDLDTVHGSILRIDPLDPAVTVHSPNPPSTNGKYRVPVDNPFFGAGRRDEIFAYGFRNPWRFSFDRVWERLVVADVGQNNIEEINLVVVGGNYGWNLKEGTFRFDVASGTVSDYLVGLPGDLIDPAAQYDHDEGISITGGFVYYGRAVPEMFGKYVFGDFSRSFAPADGRLFCADLETGSIEQLVIGVDDRDLGLYLKGFGQDEVGELYVLAGSSYGPFAAGGVVLKIVDMCIWRIPGDLNLDCEVNFLDTAEMLVHWLETAHY